MGLVTCLYLVIFLGSAMFIGLVMLLLWFGHGLVIVLGLVMFFGFCCGWVRGGSKAQWPNIAMTGMGRGLKSSDQGSLWCVHWSQVGGLVEI